MSFSDFRDAYVECALWSSTDEDGSPLDGLGLELSAELKEQVESDCEDFYSANHELWDAHGMSDSQAGHDFWLTRNHHGTGFWDRGLRDDVGEALTDSAHSWGGQDWLVGSNSEVYA